MSPPAPLLFIVRALPIHRLGGLEHHARDLILALARQGHTITILTTTGGSAQPWPTDVTEKIKVLELTGSKPGDYSLHFFRTIEPVAARFARETHASFVIPIDLTALFCRPNRFPCPVVPIIHGTLTTEVPLDRRYWRHLTPLQKIKTAWRYKTRLLLIPWFRQMLRQSETIVVDSQFTREELTRIHPPMCEKSIVVPLGLDYERYPATASPPPSASTSTLRICLLSRLQEIKGIRLALQAARDLAAAGADFTMTMGGTGDYHPEAQRLITQWGLKDKVHLAGRIEPEAVPAFFAAHNLFLFPDLTQPAFGLASLEAMHYGLPVAASHVGAVPEVVTPEVGWLYQPRNIKSLVEILTGLAKKPEFLIPKAKQCHPHAEQFTAQKMAHNFREVLRGLGNK